jgi:3-hydroxy-9,10-secoandrosta-1,3,5(10)-triene-9,17-dione monooxygenase
MADIDFVQRARDLLPALAELAPKTDELRRLPDETIAAFQEAGLFRILQPAAWGGYERDPRELFRVQRTIAEACPSSAWVLGVVAVHSWQLALFDRRAQTDVWSEDSSALISSSYAPTGKIEPVDGGFRISGRWSFSSGCDHCRWVFLGGFAPVPEGSPPDMRTFLLPRADYAIDDNWHVAGLKGTGSKDIVVEGAFVPEYRTHKLIDGYKCDSPGNAVHSAPLYRLPFGQVFVRSVSTSAIGMAQGALDAFTRVAASRIAASDSSKVAIDPATQEVTAHAASVIDEVVLVLERNFDEMMASVRAGERIDVARRVKYRYDSSAAVIKCVDAIDRLHAHSGGRAIFTGSPILRFFLDAHAARAHYANGPQKPARNYGGVQLGLANTDFFL